MKFVDKQNDRAGGFFDFSQNRLEPFLELASELGACDQRAHVETDQPLVFQAFRDVVFNDSQSKPFRNSRLSNAGFANENRVVLRSSGKNLNRSTDFRVSTDNRVQLALSGEFNQIHAVLFEGFKGRFRLRAGDVLRASNGLHGGQDFLLVDGAQIERVARFGLRLEHRQNQHLDGHVIVFHLDCQILSGLQNLL